MRCVRLGYWRKLVGPGEIVAGKELHTKDKFRCNFKQFYYGISTTQGESDWMHS